MRIVKFVSIILIALGLSFLGYTVIAQTPTPVTGGFVKLQSTSPGIQQNGYANIKGITLQASSGTATYKPSGLLYVDTTEVGTDADTNLKTLASYTLPANTLNRNGQAIRIKAYLTFANNTNQKHWELDFGNCSVSYRTTTGNGNTLVEGEIIRTSATTQKAFFTYPLNALSATLPFTSCTEDLTQDVVITIKAQNSVASAGDIVHKGWMIEFLDY